MKKSLLAMMLPALLAGCQMTTPTSSAPSMNQTDSTAASKAKPPAENDDQSTVAAAGSDTLPAEPASSDVDVLADDSDNSDKSIAPLNDLWDVVTQDFGLHYNADQKRIAVQKKWFETHPRYLERVSKRAEPFLYLVVHQLKQADMPMELALLPVVESAYDPFAYSQGRAAGMWQFISGTGDRFGLQQDWWYDGRRDVLASTKAAIAYLKYLHHMFHGDWLKALAAYNSGEGRVMRAVAYNKRRGRDTSFWSLRLPRETRAYVPRLLALAEILKSPAGRNHFKPVANAPRLAKVTVKDQLDLSVAAELAGISVKKLHALNPGFNRWATSPDSAQTLLLPIDKADAFKTKLASLPPKKRLRWARHKVKRGDSLLKISHIYDTSVASLRRANHIKGNLIRVGQDLMVPLSDQALADGRPTHAVSSRKAAISHKVHSGESLWTIAHQYRVSIHDLARWNDMKTTDPLRVNRKITIWLDGEKGSGINRNVHYKVREGDSLSTIAQRFKVSVKDLLKWNQLDPSHYLQPGQVLKLLVDVTRT